LLRSKLAGAKRMLSESPAGSWVKRSSPPWAEDAPDAQVICTICGWSGEKFGGTAHSESATCPRCGSIARDRFLVHCFAERMPYRPGLRVLETSPRLGEVYRAAMGGWFHYTSSDFDERAHRGAVRIDLQEIDLPDGSLDVILTPHVLEHVPDTDRALREIHRVLAPGGWMFLQVPVLQGRTAPPSEPEFHGDNTPVFWRFGFDLTERLRAQGFDTELLCTEELWTLVHAGASRWPTGTSPEFDVDDVFAGAIADDLVSVADPAAAQRAGFRPAYMFLTWACRKR
jgi:SAM-dependent methyltransferase